MGIKLTDFLNDTPEESKDQSKEPLTESAITEAVTNSKPLPNLDVILQEWTWRCDKGYPDFNNLSDRFKLQEVLDEMKIDLPFERIAEAPVKTLDKTTASVNLPESTTGLKEGLVMYFACQKLKDVEAAIKKIGEKSSVKLKFTTDVINNDTYNGNEEPAAENVKYAIDYLNKYTIEDSKLRKTYFNALTSAKKIIKDIGVLNPDLVDRGKRFANIKEHATELLRGADVNIGAGEADKWCPADIFIYGDAKAISSAEKATNINVDSKKQKSLNALFHETFSKPKAGTILGVSLKEEKARAGKATSFQKLLIGGKDYVVKDKDVGQEIVTKLLYNFSSIMRDTGPNNEPIYKVGDCAEALNYITRFEKDITNKGDVKALAAVKLGLEKTLKATFKSDTDKANNKENAKKLYKTGKYTYLDNNSKILTGLKDAITIYRRSLINFARAKYKESRTAFLDTVKKSGFQEPNQPEVKFVETEDISKVSDIFLKKASCYDVGAKLLDGYQIKAKLALPPAFDSIVSQDKNVFLALTAYAVSQGGISPTFFKLIGGSSATTEAHVKTFPSDGVLTLVTGGKVEIEDKPTNAGFDVSFICQIKSDSGVADKYAVVLSFAFAGTQFKIEVQELKEV